MSAAPIERTDHGRELDLVIFDETSPDDGPEHWVCCEPSATIAFCGVRVPPEIIRQDGPHPDCPECNRIVELNEAMDKETGRQSERCPLCPLNVLGGAS